MEALKNIKIENYSIYNKALELLKNIYGEDASFREGQYEAIEAAVSKKRTLVVQKTGWGKSLVYFIASKLVEGVTIIISPLLVLMDNQREFADRMGLSCGVLNSTVKGDQRSEILIGMKNNEYNVFFTTPETLFSKDVKEIIPDIHIGLFVVDECHCISDWGHDFRTEYGRLNSIIRQLPLNVNVLGTTATANDRVIEDLKKQFGDNVYVSRGPLMRDNLRIEILKLEGKAARYAWIKENINKLPGSGIIYCLTRRDCQKLSEFLVDCGINARPYYSGSDMEELNSETEKLFMNDEIKVIVATIKLGMGYDKSNIRFVIHFQQSTSLVAYYQQIGRAGRDGKGAYCYMMTGSEDRAIANYFIENAFPTEHQERQIINALDDATDGLGKNALMELSNISKKTLEKTTVMLTNWGMIYYDYSKKKYYRNPTEYVYNSKYYEEIKKIKYQELDELMAYADEKGCLSKYVIRALNDKTARECGCCYNCTSLGIHDLVSMPSDEMMAEIQSLLKNDFIEITPRKKWPYVNRLDKNTIISKQNEIGIALSKYGDEGYGQMVAYDKYKSEEFRQELVDKSIEIIKQKFEITLVTNVPSNRNRKVEKFARKVAEGLGVPYFDILKKVTDGSQQKTMQNSAFQFKNVLDTISLEANINISGNVLLIDDMVDSRWTLTVCGYWLKAAGAEKVYPFCLADSSEGAD